ncbi:MAG: ABC transporter permease [Candidatus Firestonebacteria bacterium]|nr:ABC transporter permease [Candidatus Firestonebacteria bacterium]
MKLPYELMIALRFLIKGRSQTILIIAGIAAGVAVQFFLSSLMSGLQRSLIDRTVGAAPQITILPVDVTPQPILSSLARPATNREPQFIERSELLSWQQYADFFRRVPGITAVAPVINGAANVERGGASVAVAVKGLEPEGGFAIYKIAQKIVAGRPALASDTALIGKTLASRLRLGPGDPITLTNRREGGITLLVGGVFDLGTQSAENLVFISLDRAKSLFGLSGISTIELQTADVFAASSLAARYAGEFNRIKLESWEEKNASLLQALRSQSSSTSIIEFFILFSITLGIASVLGISAVQKSRQLGILKAMGATDLSAFLLFLWRGLLLGVVGAALGTLLGYGLALLFMATAGKTLSFSFDLAPVYLVTPALLALAASTLATLLPARKASRLSPVEVIRNA